MDPEYKALLEKQQYRICGDHAAVKLCHWAKESITGRRHCYKQDFYGIVSHRCLQMTPAINECSHQCSFCWRVQGRDYEVKDWMEPKDMLDYLIEQQRMLITGYKGDSRVTPEAFEEASNPDQVAISLAGEPITYPYLSDFFKECHGRGMTTFLVTNGTYPERLEALDELPCQLYVTVAAPDRQTYVRACRPKIDDGWERIMKTLELMPSLDTRTVVRHTLVDGINFFDPEGYARLDMLADPDLIEPKGYVFVGGSRQRLSMSNMPSFESILHFSAELGKLVGMEVLKERGDSRVVLLGTPGMETDIRKVCARKFDAGRTDRL
ncbi:MAG: 4-demethylwyosine synthase TYW1 [Candidatus Methanomethylophilaceae archaeon]|jgi:tRNA wybutosine-synthesizing protein 1|nr:4-demethylwyosine synthase TYW1 [Candidatus Methanomethylophilaceae archaeon]